MASFTGIGSALGSFFGSGDLEDRFNQAIAQLDAFQQTAEQSLEGFREKGQRSFEQAFKELIDPSLAPDVAALRQFLTTEIQTGLSPFARLQFEDLNRELEGRAVQTGNLRSGAVGVQRAELGRRIAGDEFVRALQVLDTIQARDLAASQGWLNASAKFGEREVGALNAVGNAVAQVAGATIGLGQVEQQQAVALGTGLGGLADLSVQGASGYASGGGFTGMMNQLAKSGMFSSMFGGKV